MIRASFCPLCLFLALLTSPAPAQDTQAVVGQLRYQYEQCVVRAVANDFSAAGQKDMAVEQAFQACRTEEQAILRLMQVLVPNDPQFVSTAWLGYKLKVKRDIVSRMR